jgi:hypothetical protein
MFSPVIGDSFEVMTFLSKSGYFNEGVSCITDGLGFYVNHNDTNVTLLVGDYDCTFSGDNIDPYNDSSQYAYGENVGWFNFEPNIGNGVRAVSDKLTGWIWQESFGWVSLSCLNTSSCGTVDYGVTNDGSGNLSGYAWAENVGWISFSCENTSSCGTVNYGVTIDTDGNFDGWAWGENVGWIRMQSVSPVPYKVQACVVTIDDLQNFAYYWLDFGLGIPADLDDDGKVNNIDLSNFANYWLDFCPDGWQLK